MTLWLSLLLGMGLLPLTLATHDGSIDEQCLGNYKKGKTDFFLNVNESVNDGASFLSSSTVESPEECVRNCCSNPFCNLALLENGPGEGTKACYLFDCLYLNTYMCSFVRKKGFSSYILKSMLDKYLHARFGSTGKDERPPVAYAGQDEMVQPGVPVVLNSFQSRHHKLITSYRWSLVKGDTSAIMEKTDLQDQVKVSNLSIGEYVFQLTVIDSSGQSDSDDVTVRVMTPKQTKSHCLAPKKVGPCRASFLRWYYNSTNQECESFVFGGCKSNRNNYVSQEECSKACMGVSGNSTPATRGHPVPDPEGVALNITFINHSDDGFIEYQFTCTDGCCSSTDPECDNVKQCNSGSEEASCQRLNETFGHLLGFPVNMREAQCTEPPETGPCRASMTRYFYDPLNKKCFQFTYGGCKGNRNNFELESTCKDACKQITKRDVFIEEVFSQSADEEESHKGTVAVGLLLGGAAVALVAFMGYRVVKNRRQRSQHQPVPVTAPSAQEMDNSEHLVYNGTTKPL